MTMAAALKRNSIEDTTATTDFKTSVSWEDAINLYLTKESPTTKRRLKLKVPDTVFLQSPTANSSSTNTNKSFSLAQPPLGNIQLSSWTHTSKRGTREVTKRSDVDNLDLRHVCERFCRYALSNPTNARGSRFVATAYLESAADESTRAEQVQSRRRTGRLITAENFKLAIQGNPYEVDHIENTISSLRKAKYIQCYVHPHGGEMVIYRATVCAITPIAQRNMLNNFSSSTTVQEDEEDHAKERIDVETKDASPPSVDFIYFSILLPNMDKITYRISLSVFEANNHCSSSTIDNSMWTIPIPLSNWNGAREKKCLDHVRNLIGTTTEELIRHITSFPMEAPFNAPESHSLVEYMTTDYILDESRHLWLSFIPSLCISSSGSKTSHSHLVPEAEMKDSQCSPLTSTVHAYASNKKIQQTPNAALSELETSISASEKDTTKFDGQLLDSTTQSPNESVLCRVQSDVLNVMHVNAAVPVKLEGQFSPPQEDFETLSLNKLLLNETEGGALTLQQTVDDANDRYFYKELVKLKKDVVKNMQHKEEEHRQALLEVQSQLSFYKAECSCMKTKLKQLEGDCEEPKDNVMGGHLFLLDKLQQLHQEIAISQRKWGEEKRSIVSANAAAQQELLAHHRTELSQLRSVVESYEDEILSHSNLCKELEKEKATLLKQVDDSAKKMHEMSLLIERLKTENEMHAKNQSRQKVTNIGKPLDTCDCCLGVSSGNTKLANDSDVRSLVNTLEYMKTQLESEAKLKDDYVAAVELLRSEKDILLSTNQERYRALEDQKNKELSLIRQQLTGANEIALKEISILREQVGDLQVKLGDTVRGLARAQHREALARREAENDKVALELAHEELSKARIELDGCHRALNQNDSTSTAINEAILRRADNERRYLTAQIESEIALKKDLMEKLIVTEQMLLEVKTSWNNDTQILKEKLLAEISLRTRMESELRGENHQLVSEVEDCHHQLEELKQNFTKAREQFKIEQITTDQLRATNHRLLEELHALQDELIHAKIVTEETINRHSETTRIISTSIEMADETYAKKIEKLQEEANAALNEATIAKREMLQLQSNLMEEKGRLVKSCGSQILLQSLMCILRNKKQRCFSAWIRFSVIYCKAVEYAERNVEKKSIHKFQRLLLSTMKSILSVPSSEILVLQEHFDGNENLGEDISPIQSKKRWLSEESILSCDKEIHSGPWHEAGLWLRTVLLNLEKNRKRAIASVVEEEEVKRDNALQMVAAQNARLQEQIRSSHLEDVKARVKQAVEEARHEEEIEKKRMEETLTELKSALNKIKSEARAEVDFVKLAADKSLEKFRSEVAANAELERESWLRRLSEALNAQAVKNSSEMEEVLKTSEHNFLERMDCALAELQTACELEKTSEIRKTREAYEAQLAELKQAILSIQDDKQIMEGKLSDALSVAEESYDTVFDLRCSNKILQLRLSFQQFRFFVAGIKYRARFEREMKLKDDVLQGAVEATRLEFESKMQALLEQIRTFEKFISSHETLRLQMNDILVNYKREFLEEHQSKSRSVASILQSISIKQEELDNRRIILVEYTKISEEKLRSLEQEMGELSKTSTLQGGRINVAHANRKRRMNEEFENLLNDIESKKEELSNIDESIRDLLFQKDETDSVMKSLEKSLVEVLVEQQKRMLDILSKFCF
jgi:hypothetical protein